MAFALLENKKNYSRRKTEIPTRQGQRHFAGVGLDKGQVLAFYAKAVENNSLEGNVWLAGEAFKVWGKRGQEIVLEWTSLLSSVLL